MEVTQTNFNNVLPEIREAIRNCSFLSIDCELTGLKGILNYVNAFDTPKQYYEKVVKDCKEFLVIQYGITTFKYDEENDIFKHKSYNFYIFRKPINKYIQDQRFLSQTSSIDFLINQGFDFNKLFRDGISYLNGAEEEHCRKQLEEQNSKRKDQFTKQQNERDIIPIPEENQSFIDEIRVKIQNFLKTEDSELELSKCNAFLRRLIYQIGAQEFADKILLETRTINKERILFAKKFKTDENSQSEREELEIKKYDELIQHMEDYIGFSKVIHQIVESEKLVIGHNVLLDFMHTVHKFVTPLPQFYSDFKECAHSLFPKVLDTKYMASSPPFKDLINSTVLNQLLSRLLESPFKIPENESEDEHGYNLNDEKLHEAGYDSYITGLSFLAMWKYLGVTRDLPNSDIFGPEGIRLLSPYINKIFLMMLADQQYLNLAGTDMNPTRDHVFYLTFPREWNTSNIVQLFNPFGSIFISWISDSSAYVSLLKREQAAFVYKTLNQNDSYTITPFTKYQAQLAGNVGTNLISPLKRQKINNSSLSQNKRRKLVSFDDFSKSKRIISTIEEEVNEDEEEEEKTEEKTEEKNENVTTTTTTTTTSKTFEESSSWD